MKVKELRAALAGVDDDLDVEVMVYNAYQAATRKDPDYSFKTASNASTSFDRFLLS